MNITIKDDLVNALDDSYLNCLIRTENRTTTSIERFSMNKTITLVQTNSKFHYLVNKSKLYVHCLQPSVVNSPSTW